MDNPAKSLLIVLTNIGIVSGLLGGSVLGAVRMAEPFFFTFLTLNLRRMFSFIKHDDVAIKKAEEKLNECNILAGFIHSSLGSELVQNILHAFRDVIAAESADISTRNFHKRELTLLTASKSIHLLEKYKIDPRL